MQKISVLFSVFVTYSSLSGMYQQHAQPFLAQPTLAQQQLSVYRSCPSLRTMAFATTTMPQLQEKTKKMQRIIDAAKKAKNKPLAVINAITSDAQVTMGVLQILKEYKLLYSLPYKKSINVDNNRWYRREQICATLQDDNPELFKLLLWQEPLDRNDVKAILNHAFAKNRLWAIEHFLGTVEPVGSTIPVARTSPIDLEMYNELQNLCLRNNSPVIDLENGETVPISTLIAQHKMNFSPYPIGEQATEPVRREPSLHEAAYKNDIYALRNHLRTPEGRDLLNSAAIIRVSTNTFHGLVIENFTNTPLGFAIDNNNPEAAELLMRAAKECKLLETEEETLSIIKPGFLSAACEQGNPRNVLLLAQKGSPLDEKGSLTGNTPLHFAVNLNYKDNYHQELITDYLLSQNNADCTDTNKEGETPLHRAIKTFNSQYKGSNFAGFENIVNLLVKNGSPLDAQDSNGNTPLHLLIPKESFPNKVRLIDLLATKNNVNLPNVEMKTPLFLAAEETTVGPLKALLKHGASLTYRDTKDNTVLHVAAGAGNRSVVEGIIKEMHNKKVDLNIPNKNGVYPIHLAAGSSNRYAAGIVQLFLTGDNANLKDNKGNTPSHYAVGYSDCQTTKTLEVLLDAGADFNAQNEEGQSCLFYTIYNRYMSRATFLIKHGVNLLLQQRDGKTVLEYVKSHRNNKPTLVVLLKEAYQELANKKAALKKRPIYPDDESASESEKKARAEERQ